MQRPDTIDEEGNIFEPQCILKDGTIVKAEPADDKSKILHNGDNTPQGKTTIMQFGVSILLSVL